jgi:hypothetical protein
MAWESGVLRMKYQEKIPWGDCLIAGTHLVESNVVLSEDHHSGMSGRLEPTG